MLKKSKFRGITVVLLIGILCRVVPLAAQEKWPAAPFENGRPLKISESLNLAGHNLVAMLDADRNYLPNWRITVRLDNYQSNMAFWWPAHNIGRWWDAILRLEESLGYEVPVTVEKAMIQNTKAFFDNPDHIILNPDLEPAFCEATEQTYSWDLHSLREGLLALNALSKYRGQKWATEAGLKMIASLDDKLKDDGTWDLTVFDATKKRGNNVIHNLDPCDTHGRMIEALVWFYETTGKEEVKKFAGRLAEWHFNHTTQPDGNINPASKADHTHSYLGTLRGLYLYGRLTNRPEYIQRVVDAYRVNVSKIVKPSGYTSHNMVEESFGETTSPGDVAQLALWMYLDGHADFLDDAERLVRSHILPSQIISTPPLPRHILPETDTASDMYHNLEERIIGAYGGCTVYPNAGKISVLDVTSADVHSLIDIYNHIVVEERAALKVLFHFDYEDERLKIKTEESGNKRTLTVTMKQENALSVRIPHWVPVSSIETTRNTEPLVPELTKSALLFGTMPAHTTVTITYNLPAKTTKEVNFGTEYTVYWRGDNIVGMSPNYDFYPFHPRIPTN